MFDFDGHDLFRRLRKRRAELLIQQRGDQFALLRDGFEPTGASIEPGAARLLGRHGPAFVAGALDCRSTTPSPAALIPQAPGRRPDSGYSVSAVTESSATGDAAFDASAPKADLNGDGSVSTALRAASMAGFDAALALPGAKLWGSC